MSLVQFACLVKLPRFAWVIAECFWSSELWILGVFSNSNLFVAVRISINNWKNSVKNGTKKIARTLAETLFFPSLFSWRISALDHHDCKDQHEDRSGRWQLTTPDELDRSHFCCLASYVRSRHREGGNAATTRVDLRNKSGYWSAPRDTWHWRIAFFNIALALVLGLISGFDQVDHSEQWDHGMSARRGRKKGLITWQWHASRREWKCLNYGEPQFTAPF